MGLLFDSFWRAAAYCLRPRVMLLSAVPLLLMALLALVLQHFLLGCRCQGMTSLLDDSTLLASMLSWLASWGVANVMDWLAPLMVVLLASPVLVVVSLGRRFSDDARLGEYGGRSEVSVSRAKAGRCFVGQHFVVAGFHGDGTPGIVVFCAFVAGSPLVLVLPPLIWGWLTYRVMAFDALAEHASKDERREVLRRHRVTLLGMGVLTGYLGAAPSIVWASGVVFAAAFVVLLPLAIWIYTLVLRFHRCGLLTSACRRWRNCVPPILRWAPPLLCRAANGAAVPGAPGQAQPPPSSHQLD